MGKKRGKRAKSKKTSKKKTRKKAIKHYTHKGDISFGALILYNVLFFVPLIASIFLSILISRRIHDYFEASVTTVASMIMIIFTLLIFFLVIPYIRSRESTQGVRYALIGFLILALFIAVPSLLKKDLSILLSFTPHIASYILLTFIYSPEVLGMDVDISKWFQHYKQLLIIVVYGGIVVLYVVGFGYIYYSMDADPNHQAFNYDFDKEATLGTFVYYSVISFATIGYGEITPLSTAARFLASFEAILGMIVNVLFIAILFVYISNFQVFLKRQAEEEKMLKKEEKEIKALEKRFKR